MKEGKWNKIEKKILIPKIIDKSIDVVDDIAYNDLDSDSGDDNTLENWEKYSDIKYGENGKRDNKKFKRKQQDKFIIIVINHNSLIFSTSSE